MAPDSCLLRQHAPQQSSPDSPHPQPLYVRAHMDLTSNYTLDLIAHKHVSETICFINQQFLRQPLRCLGHKLSIHLHAR